MEAFDAWMIANVQAMRACAGQAANAHQAPEKLDGKEGTGRHPKDYAAQQLGGKDGLGSKYAFMAGRTSLDLLRSACPQGFEPFARCVQEKLKPVMAPH